MTQTEIAKSDQVREGAVLAVAAGGRSIALTRVAGTVQAFENKCPHLGMALTGGKIENGAIICPFHGSKFDICTGQNLDWVNGFMGIKMPGWTHGVIAMGKKPAGIKTIPASESGGAVLVEI